MQMIRGELTQRKNLVKIWTESHFSIFIQNRNWDLKFVFPFDNKKGKLKEIQNSISL